MAGNYGAAGSYTGKTTNYTSADRYLDWLYGGTSGEEETKKTSSSSSSSGRATSGASKTDTAAAEAAAYQAMIDALNAVYAQQQAAAAEAEQKKREAAQQSYDRGLAALEGAYGAVSQSAKSSYDAAIDAMQKGYDASADKLSAEAGDSLQQAYISYMMSRRNLEQRLAAQGLSGGASESTLAALENNYGNNRNAIVRDRAQNLADLLLQLNTNRASALDAYNTRMSDLEAQRMQYRAQLENELADLITSAATRNYEAQFSASNNYLSQLLALQKAMLG